MMKVIFVVILFAGINILGFVAVGQKEDAEYWGNVADEELDIALKVETKQGKAKNGILFLGDGMGITTINAARWYDIQQKQLKGSRKSLLNWEKWPFVALSRTYNVDLLTPDSAGTATAFLTGSKTIASVIGVDSNVKLKNCSTVEKAKLSSIAKNAIAEGKSVGVVTTTRITHATPSALYAHAAYRYYEGSAELPTDQNCEDIASQLINGEVGKQLKVMMGGGRVNFIPKGTNDAEYTNKASKRRDDLNLIEK